MKVTLSCRIHKEEKDQLKALSKKLGKRPSAVAGMALAKFLAENTSQSKTPAV